MRSRKLWIGLILGITIFLAAFGAAMAIVYQVSREIDAELVLSGVEVLADENLGVYWDRELKEPVTFLEFRGAALVPPLRGGVESVWVYVQNRSDEELTLIEPCREIEDAEGRPIAHIKAEVHDLDRESTGGTCGEWVALAPGEVVWVQIWLDIFEGVEPANYPFVVVFAAIGGDAEPAGKIAFGSERDGNLEIYVMNADGSNQTRLTHDANPDNSPTLSPDGSKIAFESERDGNREIYAMDADGSNQTRLTTTAPSMLSLPGLLTALRSPSSRPGTIPRGRYT